MTDLEFITLSTIGTGKMGGPAILSTIRRYSPRAIPWASFYSVLRRMKNKGWVNVFIDIKQMKFRIWQVTNDGEETLRARRESLSDLLRFHSERRGYG